MLDKETAQDIYDRTVKAWTDPQWWDLTKWERNRVLLLTEKMAEEEGPEAMTDERLEGIKEILMFEWTGEFHPWSIGPTVDQGGDGPEEASA